MPTVEATRPRPRTDHGDSPPAPPAPAATAPPRPTPAADHAVDASVVAAALNDRVLYVGMNASSVPSEVKALGANATVIAGSSSHDVTLGTASYDVTTPAGVRGLVQQLGRENGLTLRQCEQLEGILLGSPASGRDELAKIAAAWAPAERGASIPSRLVLSGHSSFGVLWGDAEAGLLHYQAVRDLGRVLKQAAAQVEDVHVSGCFSEDEVQHAEKWTQSFPNLKTVWAYGEFSPKPAAADIGAWQLATLGRTARLSEGFVASHGSATAWSVAGGVAHATMGVAERRERAEDADTRFDAYFSGRTRITNPHDPAADRDYGAYQMLASHREATLDERSHALQRGGQMLRLRFWDTSVRGELARRYGAQLDDAFTKAGLAPVDFGRLSRAEALAAIERYREVKGELGPIMDGIVELSPAILPASFCH
ncbi:MAG: hypothetical protein U0270_35085 [Labilithrix sp.]